MTTFKWTEHAQQIVQQYDTFLRAQGDGEAGPELRPLPEPLQRALAYVLARCVQATDADMGGGFALSDLLPQEIAWVGPIEEATVQLEEHCED